MSIIRRTEEWLDMPVEDEVLMMHSETGRFMSLNLSAGLIWAALEQPRSTDELVSVITDTFEVNESCARTDVNDCLATLQTEGAIVVEAG